MKVLGIDTETSGLDSTKDVVYEVGAILFDVSEDLVWTPLEAFNALIWEEGYPELTPEITKITGITCLQNGIRFHHAIAPVLAMVHQAELIVAHNAEFDKNMLLAACEKYDTLSAEPLKSKDWACTRDHIVQLRGRRCKVLSHLALDFGVAVDPRDLHRAMGDVTLMGKFCTAIKADPKDMQRRATAKMVRVMAQIPAPWHDNGVGRDNAKARLYAFDKPTNQWVKDIPEFEVEEEQQQAPFKVHIIGGTNV